MSRSGANYELSSGVYATAATVVHTSQVTGDTNRRFEIDADGTQKWGPGNTVADVTAGRDGAGGFSVTGPVKSSAYLQSYNGNAGRITVGLEGPVAQSGISFQSGESTSILYRSSFGVLRTSGALTVDGALTAGATTVTTLGNGTQTFTDAANIVFGTTTGTMIGTSISQKIGFYNATPIVQRSGAAQVAVVTTAPTQTTPFGFSTSAQAAAIVTLVNEIQATLVALGLMKGSA